MNKQKKPREICGAKTRSGEPCRLTAGYGTNHFGEGKCKFHGGSSTGPKVANTRTNAVKHGLYQKYLPKEVLETIKASEGMNSLDILWSNIEIQYANILRSQKIMLVKTQKDLVKELKSFKELPNGMTQEEYEIQFAWDRQERFMASMARAMNNLANMLNKYEELCNKDLMTEEQTLKLEKMRTEIDILKGVSEEVEDLSDIHELIYGKKEDD